MSVRPLFKWSIHDLKHSGKTSLHPAVNGPTVLYSILISRWDTQPAMQGTTPLLLLCLAEHLKGTLCILRFSFSFCKHPLCQDLCSHAMQRINIANGWVHTSLLKWSQSDLLPASQCCNAVNYHTIGGDNVLTAVWHQRAMSTCERGGCSRSISPHREREVLRSWTSLLGFCLRLCHLWRTKTAKMIY